MLVSAFTLDIVCTEETGNSSVSCVSAVLQRLLCRVDQSFTIAVLAERSAAAVVGLVAAMSLPMLAELPHVFPT